MDRMETELQRRRVARDTNGRPPLEPIDDVSIGDLFKRMTSDASLLVRQEISLAKAEMKESVTRLRQMVTLVAIAAALAIPGAIALTAAIVIGLGQAINSYWGSALIVGAALVGAAAMLVQRGLAKVSDGKLGMKRTTSSLGNDAQWAREELRAVKRELTA